MNVFVLIVNVIWVFQLVFLALYVFNLGHVIRIASIVILCDVHYLMLL